jgi:tetratricopeptide (TPR) repeat protein
MKCPIDGLTDIQEGESPCHQCGADLSFYWKVHELPVALLNEAQSCIEKKAWEDAITKLQTVQELSPTFWEAFLLLGDIYAMTGRNDKAVQQWEKAQIVNPDNEEIQKRIEEYKPLTNSTNKSLPVTSQILKESSISIAFFVTGFILFIIPAFFSVLGQQFHYSQPEQTKFLLIIMGVGSLLFLIGMNLRNPNNNSKIIFIPGLLLVAGSLIAFYMLYNELWYFPISAVVLFFLVTGMFLLLLSIFFGLVQKPKDHPEKV